LNNQIKHLEKYITEMKEKISIFRTITERLQSVFNTEKHRDIVKQITQEILDYISFEKKYILFNYDNLLHFFVGIKKVNPPSIIHFWSTDTLRQRLAKRARHIPSVKVTGLLTTLGVEVGESVLGKTAEFAIDMSAFSIIMAGGGMVTTWINEEDQKKFIALQKKSQKISASWKAFQNSMNAQQKDAAEAIINVFKSKQSDLSEKYKKTDEQLQQKILYLNRSINLAKPATRFVYDPVQFDQVFAASPMFTPESPYTWYNIFKVQPGDWEFNSETNSFWQYGLTQYPKVNWDKGNEGTSPAQNAIFTEYITPEKKYTIEIECRLVNLSYPFFAGIEFNKGRWISGSPERLSAYRLIGFYGTEKNKTKNIDLYFAQQKIIQPTKKGGIEQIISPMQQIETASGTAKKLFTLEPKDVALLSSTPITFVLSIQTEPSTVSYTLSKKEIDDTGKEVATELNSGTISKLEQFLFIYGGLGFISSGCQAEFKIIKPEKLTYSKAETQEFEQDIIQKLKK